MPLPTQNCPRKAPNTDSSCPDQNNSRHGAQQTENNTNSCCFVMTAAPKTVLGPPHSRSTLKHHRTAAALPQKTLPGHQLHS